MPSDESIFQHHCNIICALYFSFFQVEELQPSKKRRRPSDEVLRLIVRGLGYCAPPPTPEGVQEVRQWIEKELDELQVSHSLVLATDCEMKCSVSIPWFTGYLLLGNLVGSSTLLGQCDAIEVCVFSQLVIETV